MNTMLSDLYRPITAVPFRNNSEYCEFEPCSALKPYIRCFWGTPSASENAASPFGDCGLIIPDTCMDIIFKINYTQNCVYSIFCALDDRSCILPEEWEDNSKASVFAIRFYAWTAALFAEDTLAGSKNGRYPVDAFFSAVKRKLEPILLETESPQDKIRAAEKILLECLRTDRAKPDLMNAVYRIISQKGNTKVSDLTSYTVVSEKQLERLFSAAAGISPKALCSLMRYQMLWQEMLFSRRFNALDAVEKYGYFDQAHMINDFKRRHMMNPTDAVSYAKKHI